MPINLTLHFQPTMQETKTTTALPTDDDILRAVNEAGLRFARSWNMDITAEEYANDLASARAECGDDIQGFEKYRAIVERELKERSLHIQKIRHFLSLLEGATRQDIDQAQSG